MALPTAKEMMQALQADPALRNDDEAARLLTGEPRRNLKPESKKPMANMTLTSTTTSRKRSCKHVSNTICTAFKRLLFLMAQNSEQEAHDYGISPASAAPAGKATPAPAARQAEGLETSPLFGRGVCCIRNQYTTTRRSLCSKWLKDILGDSYTEEIDKQVSDEIGKAYAPRADLDSANEARAAAEAQLADANKTIAGYKDMGHRRDPPVRRRLAGQGGAGAEGCRCPRGRSAV